MKAIFKIFILNSLLLALTYSSVSLANAGGLNSKTPASQLTPAEWQVKNTFTAALNLIFNYDAGNITTQREKASHYFTQNGWQIFQHTLDQTNEIKQIEKEKVTATIILDTNMTLQMTKTAPFVWTATVPITVIYQPTTLNTVTKNFIATAKIAQDAQHEYKIQQLTLESK